jgi:hypothetical protein
VFITGGTAGIGSLFGGGVTIRGGVGNGAAGGNVNIFGGAGTPSGFINIGTGGTQAVNLGSAAVPVRVNGQLEVATTITAPEFVGLGVVPVGTVVAFMNNYANAPTSAELLALGWAFCDGSVIPVCAYSGFL